VLALALTLALILVLAHYSLLASDRKYPSHGLKGCVGAKITRAAPDHRYKATLLHLPLVRCHAPD
jgi:hypothetical protein